MIFVSVCHKIKVYLRFVMASLFPLSTNYSVKYLYPFSIINIPFSPTFNKSWLKLKTTPKPLFIIIFFTEGYLEICVPRHYYQVTGKIYYYFAKRF